jgi:hypothetical protein
MDRMSSEPPTISYLSDAEPRVEGLNVSEPLAPEEAPKERGLRSKAEVISPYLRAATRIFSGFTWIVLGVVLLFWAVIGAVFWIPLLLRAMLRYSLSLVEAMFEGERPLEAGKTLRNAVSFYRRGFVVAIEAVIREDLEKERRHRGAQPRENRLLLEVVWAAVVWYFIFLWLGWIQTSPLDMWDWFVSRPWGEAWRGLLDLVGL